MSTSSTIADSSAPSANHTIIRVGLIGVGNWALNGPVRVLSLMPQYEMAAVYSQRRDAAQSAADTFGIRHVVGSIDELVRHPDVDIVLVPTTGPQHEEAVRAAIAAGKTVYCEWPLTPDSKTSAELVDLAAKAGVQTILGTQRRFAPGLRYLKDLLGDGYVGRVRSVRMHVTVSSFGKNRSKALRWSAFPENFMGVTSIFGAHLMDPLFSIVGRPTEISAVSVNQWPEITIVETGEEISTKVPDQLLLQGILASGAVFAVHIEGGKPQLIRCPHRDHVAFEQRPIRIIRDYRILTLPLHLGKRGRSVLPNMMLVMNAITPFMKRPRRSPTPAS